MKKGAHSKSFENFEDKVLKSTANKKIGNIEKKNAEINGKRAKDSYNYVIEQNREKVKEENPGVNNKEILRILGKKWSNMPEADKKNQKYLLEEENTTKLRPEKKTIKTKQPAGKNNFNNKKSKLNRKQESDDYTSTKLKKEIDNPFATDRVTKSVEFDIEARMEQIKNVGMTEDFKEKRKFSEKKVKGTKRKEMTPEERIASDFKCAVNESLRCKRDSYHLFKTTKCCLKSIMREKGTLHSVNETVINVHKICVHTLQFLKLLLIRQYEYNSYRQKVKLLNKYVKSRINNYTRKRKSVREQIQSGNWIYKFDFTPSIHLIYQIMTVVADEGKIISRSERQPSKDLMTIQLLRRFYFKVYRKLVPEDCPKMTYSKIQGILKNYTAETLLINIKNSIVSNCKQVYRKFLETVIKKGIYLTDKKLLKSKTNRNLILLLTNRFSELSDPHIKNHLPHIIPKSLQQSILLDCKNFPFSFLPILIYMERFIENKGRKVCNLLPLKTGLIPQYIKIDTASLLHLIFDKDKCKLLGATKTKMQNNLTLYKNDIWKMLFKTERRIFCTSNKIYEFHGMIETDGFGASVILKKRDEENLRINSDENEIYIEDCDFSSLRNKTIVGIDPNKSELIYASSYIDGQLTKFKYTQKQRNFESKRDIYDEKLEEFKENALLDGKKVTYWEDRLSKYSKKSFNSRSFAKYVKEKNLLNSKLYKFYEQEIFRKFRWFKKINLQRSEDLLINRFCEKFGPPSTTAIAFGDWDEGGGGKHMKFLQPTKKE